MTITRGIPISTLVLGLFLAVLLTMGMDQPARAQSSTATAIPPVPATLEATPPASSTPLASATMRATATVAASATATPTEVASPTATPETGDPYEMDNPPHQAGYAGAQRRSFAPAGDEDFVRYRLKAGLRIWVETSSLAGGADTEVHLFRDEDGLLQPGDEWLASDDDGGSGLGSLVSVELNEDAWLTILVLNQGAAWGADTAYTLRIISAEEATPVPVPPTVPATHTQVPVPPTYTPYPTLTAVPTYTPYPTSAPVVVRPPAPVAPAPVAPAPVAPVPVAPSAPVSSRDDTPTGLRLLLFLDGDRNGMPGWGEEVSGVMAEVSTRDGQWTQRVIIEQGEAYLAAVPAGRELVVRLPYLHRSLVVRGRADQAIPLALPTYPIYLP